MAIDDARRIEIDFSDADTVSKLQEYLLSPTHPKGRHKLKLFESRFGIGPDDHERCAEMLIEASQKGVLQQVRERPECQVVGYRCDLVAADGSSQELTICWRVPHDGGRPSLVTAYPYKDPSTNST